MNFFKRAAPNPLDYSNLNVMLAKQVAELESQVVDLNRYIQELEKKMEEQNVH